MSINADMWNKLCTFALRIRDLPDMFKKTVTTSQLDMFASPVMQLCNRASRKYTDPKAWQNMFYRLVTTKVDESLFAFLFPAGKKNGRPNASIRVLVAMSVLKEGFGCSDEDLFEKCDFDMLTHKALGLEHLNDAAPSIDTWFYFAAASASIRKRRAPT